MCLRQDLAKEQKAKERHDKEEGIVFPYPLSIGQEVTASKADHSYGGGKVFPMTKPAKASNDSLGRLCTLHTWGIC